MGDFVSRSVVKSAVRTLAVPIEDVTAFTAIVNDIVANNPFECTSYQVGEVSHAAVEKSRESYTARIIYEDGEAVTVGTVSAKCPTVAAYNSNASTIVANAALATAMGGTAVHATDSDTFSATIKCHDANGEVYNVAISRTQVTVSGYEADAILTTVETWADTVTALA